MKMKMRFKKILSHAGCDSYLIFFKVQWFGDSIPNEFRGTFLQRESKHTETLIGRHPIGHLRTHMHVILELPVPKEVSLTWDLINLSASSSSQDFSEREREKI